MEPVSKNYLSEREILERINNNNESVCSQSSVELFSESDSDTKEFPYCDNKIYGISNLFTIF